MMGCHKWNAMGNELAGSVEQLPPDHVGDFAPRARASDCCVVIRHWHMSTKVSPPRRCRSKRARWNPRFPERSTQTCRIHGKYEEAAKAWAADV